jgi:hypothetical protein
MRITLAMLWLCACLHAEPPRQPSFAPVASATAADRSTATLAPSVAAAEVRPPPEPVDADRFPSDPQAHALDLCNRLAGEFRKFGETIVFERRHYGGERLVEVNAWCLVWVRPPGNQHEVCYVQMFDTAADAEAFAVQLQKPWMDGPPLAAKLSGGTFSLRRPDGREVFWCGAGKVVAKIEQVGRAFIEGTMK